MFLFPFLFLGYYTADVYRSARCRRGSLCVSFLLQSVFLWIVVFRHRPREIPIFKPAFGHRIPASRRKWITSQNARDREPQRHEKKTLLKRLKRIPRAGRCKTAGWRSLERRQKFSIEFDRPNKEILHRAVVRNISSFAKPRRRSFSTSVDFASKIPFRGVTTTRNPVLSSGSTAR